MSHLIHVDGDEVDMRYKLELNDEDLVKIKAQELNSGKACIHQAYLNKLWKNLSTDINEDDIKRMRLMKFEHGPHLKPDQKWYHTSMMFHFIDKLVMLNKIGVQFYKYNEEIYLETEIFNP